MNKKGFVQDSLYFIYILFAIALALPALYVVIDSVADAFTDDPIITSESDSGFQDLNNRFPSIFDFVILFVFLGIVFGAIIVSYLIPSNPLIFIFMIFLAIIFAALAGFLSNAWEGIASTDTLGPSISNFPMTNWILDNYLLVTVISFFLMAIAFYTNPEGGI